jgi:2-oxoglutarate/2-oxoacid ferredoxin oxidoreductase subunit beta
VAFNNEDSSRKSYAYGRDHEQAIQEIGWVPQQEEIVIEPTEPGEVRVVALHDGSRLRLQHLEEQYDPTDRVAAVERLLRAEAAGEFLTGLLYYDPSRRSLAETLGLDAVPLSAMPDDRLRPPPEALTAMLQRY